MPWEDQMAKPNYQFEKRQRDLAKKKKKEEKLLKKQQAKGIEGIEGIEGMASRCITFVFYTTAVTPCSNII